MDLSSHFVDFAQLGANWVLWVLIALSVISIAVMIDRAMWFRRRDLATETFLRELKGACDRTAPSSGGAAREPSLARDRDDLEHFVTKYKDDPAVAVQVALRGVAERDRGAEAAAEAMHGERARWRRAADKNLIVLGTLGNNVPFVGLFGTVLGIINAFEHLAHKTADAEAATLKEIGEALSATAFGLAVAIPAVVAFNFFSRKLKVIMGGADEVAHAVLAIIHGEEHARGRGK